MAVEVITKEDLEAFGEKLLNQMKALLGQGQDDSRKFLKTYQVKNLLKISNNTLQLLRDDGTIPFTKIGGIFYYSQEDILKVLKGESLNKQVKFSR